MSRPALVLFDLDEVLVGYDHAARVAHLARATGTSAEAAHEALYTSGFERDADRGVHGAFRRDRHGRLEGFHRRVADLPVDVAQEDKGA